MVKNTYDLMGEKLLAEHEKEMDSTPNPKDDLNELVDEIEKEKEEYLKENPYYLGNWKRRGLKLMVLEYMHHIFHQSILN